MNLDIYADVGDKFFDTIPQSKIDGEKLTKFKKLYLMTSRGCPFGCQFCSTSVFWQHRWHGRTPKNIVDEIEHLMEKYNARVFGLNDDCFNVDQNRIIEMSKEIINRGLDIKWFCGGRADMQSLEMLKWMKKSGCFATGDALESGSPKILQTINKRFTVEHVLKAQKMYRDVGISTSIGIMVGNPGETNQTIKETIKILDMIKPDGVGINLTTVYPGTQLYELAKSQNFIRDTDWLKPDFLPPVYTVENSIETLMKWKQQIMTHFWFKIFGFKRAAKFVFDHPIDTPMTFVYWLKRTFGKRHQIM
jgi:radical SAM superfamily enzyme YgiQ (UPF0313 family)